MSREKFNMKGKNMSFLDFREAEDMSDYSVIPAKEVVRVKTIIKKGNYNNDEMGLKEGWASKSDNTGAIYLNCEFKIISQKYNGIKIFQVIGIHSNKGERWGNMGKSFIKAILNSHFQLDPFDKSEFSEKKRILNNIGDLHGMDFIAEIGVENDKIRGGYRNTIKKPIMKNEEKYKSFISNGKDINEVIGNTSTSIIDIDDDIPF